MRYSRIRASLLVLLAGIVTSEALDRSPLSAATQAAPPVAGALSRAEVDARLEKVRAELFSRPDRASEAIRELTAILAIDPSSSMAHVLLGLAHLQSGNQDMLGEAIAELRQALAIEPGLAPARFYLARVYLSSQPDRAREEIRLALQMLPDHPQFLAVLGEAERRLGSPARALEITQQALASDPTLVQARYYMALALIDLGRREDAIQQLEHLGRTDPGNPDVFFSLGMAYLEANRLDDALNALTHGTTIAPPRPEVRIAIGRAYRLKGDFEKADQQLALAFEPGASIQVSSLYQQLEADLNLERGLVRLQQGRLDEAVAAFRASLEIDPDHAAAHRHLAEVYERQGRKAEAATHAARAKALGARKAQLE